MIVYVVRDTTDRKARPDKHDGKEQAYSTRKIAMGYLQQVAIVRNNRHLATLPVEFDAGKMTLVK